MSSVPDSQQVQVVSLGENVINDEDIGKGNMYYHLGEVAHGLAVVPAVVHLPVRSPGGLND